MSGPKLDVAEEVFGELEAVLQKHSVLQWPPVRRRQLLHLLGEYVEKVSAQAAGDSSSGLPKKRKRCEREREQLDGAGDCGGGCDRETHEGEEGEAVHDELNAVPQYSEEVLLVREMKLFKELHRLRSYLHQKVPYGSIGERSFTPQYSQNFSADVPTFEVDAFMYDDEHIDQLCDEGKLSRDYCKKCSSTEIGHTQLISHSFSIEQLIYIFSYLFPKLIAPAAESASVNKLVDVGSRFGVVLAAAHGATDIPVIRGIEISDAFVSIQQEVIAKHRLAPRVSVLCCDAMSEEGLTELRSASVLFLHNVFEWFVPEGDLLGVWKLLAHNLPAGQIIVASPSLEDSLNGACEAAAAMGNEEAVSFKRLSFLRSWVKELDPSDVLQEYITHRMNTASTRGGGADGGEDAADDAEAVENEEEECIELARSIHVYKVLAPLDRGV